MVVDYFDKGCVIPHSIAGYCVTQPTGEEGRIMRRLSRIDLVLVFQVKDVIRSDKSVAYSGQLCNSTNSRFLSLDECAYAFCVCV